MNDTTTPTTLDAIERTIELPHPVDRVWRAISDPAEIGRWFPNESATLDVRVGGTGEFVWIIEDKEIRTEIHVHEVDEPRRFVWSWGHEPSNTDEPVTTVEFELSARRGRRHHPARARVRLPGREAPLRQPRGLGRGARRAGRVPRVRLSPRVARCPDPRCRRSRWSRDTGRSRCSRPPTRSWSCRSRVPRRRSPRRTSASSRGYGRRRPGRPLARVRRGAPHRVVRRVLRPHRARGGRRRGDHHPPQPALGSAHHPAGPAGADPHRRAPDRADPRRGRLAGARPGGPRGAGRHPRRGASARPCARAGPDRGSAPRTAAASASWGCATCASSPPGRATRSATATTCC